MKKYMGNILFTAALAGAVGVGVLVFYLSKLREPKLS